MNVRLTVLCLALLGIPAFAAENAAAVHAAQMEQGLALFNSDVAALLKEHCLKCHGGEKGSKGGLDLVTREFLLKGGDNGPGVVPGKSAESLLVQSIRHEDEDLKMPAKADKLPEAAIAKIAQWVDLGAPYGKPLIEGAVVRDKSKVTDEDRKWWAFRPLAEPEPPAVKDGAWGRTAVDRFVLAKLEEKGLRPNPAADPRKLIRRATLDVIGLPPVPERVEAFVGEWARDPRAAMQGLVRELLASPHYGERWGRHWLDLARYAESHGYEQDYDRKFAYPYRDFVIRALNSDLPYDEFVRWQIAGDELAPENPEAWFATGFLAAGTHATQITANQAEKERYDELDDKVGTIGTAMLGLTIACARCHDHKFDPIPENDYYRVLSAFTQTVRSDYDVEINAAQTREKRAIWERERTPLTEALAKYEKEELPGRFAAWLAAKPELPQPAWLTLEADKLQIKGTYYVLSAQKKQADGSYVIGVNAGTPDTYVFTTKTLPAGIAALRLEALGDASLPNYGPGWSGEGEFKLTQLTVSAKGKDGKPLEVKLAGWRSTDAPDKVVAATDLWTVPRPKGRDLAAVYAFEKPLAEVGELTVTMRFDGNFDRNNLGRFRLAVSADAGSALGAETFPVKDYLVARTALATADRRPAELAALSKLHRTIDSDWRKLADAAAVQAKTEPRPQFQKALVCSEGLPAVRLHTQGPDFYDKTYHLKRGDVNQKQAEALPGFLQVASRAEESRWLTAPPANARTPFRRAALARWLTDTESGAGQLLARVIVNRLWQHHFGRGLVATPSDFGAQGEKPSHPELLDWLAGELIRNGWRLKPLHELIMNSAVYQQSAERDPARQAVDPENKLLWRRTPQRLEGEVIRDSILAVTGTLDRRMFGAGTLDPEMRRRSIYFQIKRSALPPMLVTFDAPDTLTSMGQRSSTTVAPQALLLMNNAAVRRAAREWAKSFGDLPAPEAVKRAYTHALGRAPNEGELADVTAFLAAQTDSYTTAGKPEPASLALTDFCQSLLSTNEFVFVE